MEMHFLRPLKAEFFCAAIEFPCYKYRSGWMLLFISSNTESVQRAMKRMRANETSKIGLVSLNTLLSLETQKSPLLGCHCILIGKTLTSTHIYPTMINLPDFPFYSLSSFYHVSNIPATCSVLKISLGVQTREDQQGEHTNSQTDAKSIFSSRVRSGRAI